jgi:hypothetical protein
LTLFQREGFRRLQGRKGMTDIDSGKMGQGRMSADFAALYPPYGKTEAPRTA